MMFTCECLILDLTGDLSPPLTSPPASAGAGASEFAGAGAGEFAGAGAGEFVGAGAGAGA